MTAATLHASPFDAFCSHVVYETAYFASTLGMTLGWSLRTAGRQHIPAEGPVLIVANHQSFIDPILVGLGTRRHLCYLARKTLFHHAGFAWMIRMLNAVPIDQDGVGKDGIRAILEQLQRGRAVVVFPEGNRTEDGAMQPLKPGIHLLIKRTQAPIVPVGIAGAYEAWPRWRRYPLPAPLFLPASPRSIAVSIGKPLEAKRFAEMGREESMRALQGEIEAEWRRAEKLRRKE